jgi:polyisoprenoid-binding protein YceI
MQTKVFYLFLILLVPVLGITQDKFFTKSGRITFYSATAMEHIEAINKTVTCVIDTKTGDIQFAVLMKGFEFRKALMQEDFNDTYVESNKYPRSTFKGKILNNTEINYNANGNYPATATGLLVLHGVSREISAPGTISVTDGKLRLNAEFDILLTDYKIAVPALVRDKISKSIKINIQCNLDPLQ